MNSSREKAEKYLRELQLSLQATSNGIASPYSSVSPTTISIISKDAVEDLVSLLDSHAKEAKAEQRKDCAIAVSRELEKRDWVIKSDKHLQDACLNATGESDE